MVRSPPDVTYLFAFKLFDTKEAALEQIKTQAYFQSFLRKGKAAMIIGMEFNKEERNIGAWVTEMAQPA